MGWPWSSLQYPTHWYGHFALLPPPPPPPDPVPFPLDLLPTPRPRFLRFPPPKMRAISLFQKFLFFWAEILFGRTFFSAPKLQFFFLGDSQIGYGMLCEILTVGPLSHMTMPKP